MKIINVVAAVIKKEDKIFITRRSYGEFKDMWEFPGGKIESGETKEEALIREIKEELELDIKIIEYITTVNYDYPDFHLNMDCFMCEICGGSLNLNAHNDAKWASLEELSLQTWVPADIDIINELLKKY
ncbi:MAG: (deoxy)nucleoside triphosphate pyrophosphohydrolase [Clostridium sp.]|uniref:(deoxy)nucleoside triphosphate pyrophosphohydrolase n=1 Tax=Clostridium sp. TaxID=1506 RepID=UPI0025B88B2F|nr:(deoxy)nucleoside triphosphate pyrophosphohydrolase [Clostridium sp.]MCF0146800.1 (deoxy)nucleoside triphosphate pyrophosphohydrolase [Clostridium sp.]